jgi:hypothetical protein
MPRVRRRAIDRREEWDCERTRERFEHGDDFEMIDGPFLGDDELAEAWEDLRDELVAEHIAQEPGTRPWAWWRWEAPEPRRQISAGPEPVLDHGLWFGKPRCYRGVPPSNMFESEADFLDRLNLLTSAERASLNR